jgi:hypothetical protein
VAKAKQRRRDREKSDGERKERATPSPPSSASPSPSLPPGAIARSWKRVLLLAIAIAYLCTVWLDGIGSTLPSRTLPRPWVYFAQVAALFKNAGVMSIDYRAEGWSCSEKKWIEIDVRPFFRVDADTKESRFHRALQFYRHERKVMRALDEYVTKSVNAKGDTRFGGVRFLSLRVPFPKPGERIAPYERKPLSSYPDEQRHAWYWSPKSMRIERCGSADAVPHDDDERGTSPPPPEEKSEKNEKRKKGAHAASSSSGSSSAASPPFSSERPKEPEP